ncbi:peptidase M38 family protein [Nocardia brasiliensis NBRC 14402]|uniref:amidohydrolase n=1 Tax=Nocardia brasiliensis TaxID=37326 RepID=UPI00030D5839|nr:amidohydrolase [Nocardia brasiliensis]ASF07194.1 amidohydrolase [Nocardia brasiliensis]GAJ84891.1 peptidase M38 family protein [Nocardia brasiliensis NBRC 14402]SUB47531.1 N-substituted formamide deformylase precursor [Nocardia brasiliensis]
MTNTGDYADLILLAARVHTLDPARPHAQAVAMKGDRIIGVGGPADVRDWRGARTEVIDLGDTTITPGLVDGHAHPLVGADMTNGVDLSSVSNVDELISALRAEGVAPVDGWIRGWGLDPNVFADQPITFEPLLRAVAETIPVYLDLNDAHSALVNPAALRAAGVTGHREFDQGARIVCDSDGRPTGHLLEPAAMDLVLDVAPVAPMQVRRGRVAEVLRGMAATGLTAANVMDFDGDSEELITGLAAELELPVQLRFAPRCHPGTGRAGLEHIVDLQRRGGRRWQVDGVKFVIDGTIDGGTAWLDEPDSHGESTVPFWPDPAQYREAVHYLAARGVPTVTHAIGDAGVRYALETLATAALPPSGVRHRIEHIETIPTELVAKFREYGVVASMQPTHCSHFTRADHTDNWSARLGDERASRGFRTRDLRDAGATVALGSDWPIGPYDARAILADAQLRRPAGRSEVEPVSPKQSLTAAMALEGYTSHAARAAGREGAAGRVAIGCAADLTVFSLDPLVVPPDELAGAPIASTVVGGAVVHRAEFA